MIRLRLADFAHLISLETRGANTDGLLPPYNRREVPASSWTGWAELHLAPHLAGSIRRDESGHMVGSAGLSVLTDGREIEIDGRQLWSAVCIGPEQQPLRHPWARPPMNRTLEGIQVILGAGAGGEYTDHAGGNTVFIKV